MRMLDPALLALMPSLIAMVEQQSVTAAARSLSISQPRMSARLVMLRERLDDPILVPAGGRRGMMATARAIELAASARSAVALLERSLASPSFDPATAERVFRVMVNDTVAVMVGVPLLQAIERGRMEGIGIAFFDYDQRRLDQLETGDLDLVLARPHQLRRSPMLTSRTVLRDGFRVIARAGAQPAPIDLDAFCARPHLLISSRPGRFHGAVDEALAKLGRKRTIAAAVENHLLAMEMVAATELIATVPQSLLRYREHRLDTFEPPLSFDPFTVCAAWHPQSGGDAGLSWLRTTLLGALNAAGADD